VGLISRGIDKLVDRKVGNQQQQQQHPPVPSWSGYRLPPPSPYPHHPSPLHSGFHSIPSPPGSYMSPSHCTSPAPPPFSTMNGVGADEELPDVELPKPETGIKVRYLGVTKRCRLSWLTNSALVYEPKCGGRRGVRGSQPMSTAVHRSPNKLWRSNSIFILCTTLYVTYRYRIVLSNTSVR
jgi:hypothetical protein